MTVRFRSLDNPEPLQNLKLRKEDQDELETMYGLPANKVLLLSWSLSLWVKVAEVEDRIVTVFGLTHEGNPWMVGTVEMLEYPITIVKSGYKYVKECLECKNFIWNYVDSRNIVHIKWLMRLGFKFTGSSVTINNVEFLYFYKLKG